MWWYNIAALFSRIPGDPINKLMDNIVDNIANGNALRIYKTYEYIIGGNVIGRDFSESAKKALIEAAKETEEEAWWRVDRWDCWYKVEKFFGNLKLDNYTANVDKYYRKLIDINDASIKDINKIFEKVYSVDDIYSSKMNNTINNLEIVINKLKQVDGCIVPQQVH